MARDGRVVQLVDGGAEAVVAAVFGGATAGYRVLSARLADPDDEMPGIVELLPPGGSLPPGPRTRANVSLAPLPGGAGDPDTRSRPGHVRAARAVRSAPLLGRGRGEHRDRGRRGDAQGEASRHGLNGCSEKSWWVSTVPDSSAGWPPRSDRALPVSGASVARVRSAPAIPVAPGARHRVGGISRRQRARSRRRRPRQASGEPEQRRPNRSRG